MASGCDSIGCTVARTYGVAGTSTGDARDALAADIKTLACGCRRLTYEIYVGQVLLYIPMVSKCGSRKDVSAMPRRRSLQFSKYKKQPRTA
jgi:hypothetical protein